MITSCDGYYKMTLALVSVTILYSIISQSSVKADFIYEDFDKTLGLNINGDAATFGCKIKETYSTYHEQIANRLKREKMNETDLSNSDVIGKGSTSHEYKQTVRTNDKTTNENTNKRMKSQTKTNEITKQTNEST